MLRVGLTGGIACGKTRVARRLAAAGLQVIDLDAVAHELTAPGGAAYADVVRAFGPDILAADGAIDRRALAARVFPDAEALGRLNALVHPRVREEEARRAAALAGTDAVFVTDAALLVESGLHLRFDRLVVVDCLPEQQLRRLASREGMTEATARARIAAQMPVTEKRRFGHFVIDGSLAFEETDRQTDEVAARLRSLAASPPARVAVPPDRALAALVYGPGHGPRGLTPALLLREIVEGGGLEMQRLAALLVPAAGGPWYRAADAAWAEPGPETLAASIALWSLARRGDDAEYTASVAASVARLTHEEPRRIADASLVALVLAAAGTGGLERVRQLWAEHERLAQRWGGAPPSRAAADVLEAAGRHPDDAAAACAWAKAPVGPLAGALVGIAAGRAVTGAPSALVADVAALARLSPAP
jgi:dephospho-CoA kinase